MDEGTLWLLVLAIGIVAFLYASVGHAGASGYIAVMTLAGLAPAVVKPGALVLNVLVASIGSWQFWRAGHFRWALFWPFALLATPMAFLGGYLDLPTRWFKLLVGVVLLLSAAWLLWHPAEGDVRGRPGKPVALGTGGVLGFFAGLTGTGGGIFLTPTLLLMRWAGTREAAAVSALFILCNSVAGLLGNISATGRLPALVWPMAGAALLGGVAGSWLGARRFPTGLIRRLLALVLVVAGAKLVAGA